MTPCHQSNKSRQKCAIKELWDWWRKNLLISLSSWQVRIKNMFSKKIMISSFYSAGSGCVVQYSPAGGAEVTQKTSDASAIETSVGSRVHIILQAQSAKWNYLHTKYCNTLVVEIFSLNSKYIVFNNKFWEGIINGGIFYRSNFWNQSHISVQYNHRSITNSLDGLIFSNTV